MCHEFGTFGERRVNISSGAAADMSATLETVPVCEGFECVVCCFEQKFVVNLSFP